MAHKAGNEKLFKDRTIKKTMKKALDWQLEHPKHALYDWTNGAFYAGVFAAYETTGSKKIYNAIYEMGESNRWSPGTRLHHAAIFRNRRDGFSGSEGLQPANIA